MSKVIALGPRGGKIIGYKGGSPVYLQEEEAELSSVTASIEDPAMLAWEQLSGKRAFSVSPINEAFQSTLGVDFDELTIIELLAEKDHGKVNLLTGDSLNFKNKNTRLFQLKGKDNVSTALMVIGRSLGDVISQSLDFRNLELMKLVVDDNKQMSAITVSPSASGGMERIIPGHGTKAETILKVSNLLKEVNVKTNYTQTAGLISAIIEERLVQRVLGFNPEESTLFISPATTVIPKQAATVLTIGAALQNPASAHFSPHNYTSPKQSEDPVLTAVFEYCQNAPPKLALKIHAQFATLKAKYNNSAATHASSVTAMQQVFTGVLLKLTKPMGGAKALAEKVDATTASFASIHNDITSFAEMCLQGVVQEPTLTPKLKPGDEAQKNPPVEVPKEAAPTEPPPAPAEKPEGSAKHLFPNFSKFDSDDLKTATSAIPLPGSTQGGFILETKESTVVIKNSKNSYVEAVAHGLFNGIVGDEHCPPAITYKAKSVMMHGAESAKEQIKGVPDGTINNGVILPFIENSGELPKLGSQIDAVLNPDQKAQLVGLGMVSWVLGDADAHGGNYIINANGNLTRIDLGQANFVYSHIDSTPSHNVSPNSNEIALNTLLRHYAGENETTAPDADIDLNHPFILEALEKIEKYDFSGSVGLGSKAKVRAKIARKHFETMISGMLDVRTNSSGSDFKFGDDKFSAIPAWTSEGKKPLESHHFAKPFEVGEVLQNMAGVHGAQLVRNKFDGAKYIRKSIPADRKISALGETCGSIIAVDLLPTTIDGSGSPVQHTAAVYLIKEDSNKSQVVQRRLFNSGQPGGGHKTNWKPHQREQLGAIAMVRYLVGDHDGHSEQYLWTDPPTGGEKSLIGIDWGNAFKYTATTKDKVDFEKGYFSFQPQSEKMDKKLWTGYMAGSFDVDWRNDMILHIANECKTNAHAMIEKMQPYLDHAEKKFGKDKADKMKALTLQKMVEFTESYEKWITTMQTKRAANLGETAPPPFKLHVDQQATNKAMRFKVTQREDDLYKSLKVLPLKLVFNDIETQELSDYGLSQLTRFTNDIVRAFGDKTVSDEMLRTEPKLRRTAFLLSTLEEHTSTIMQDPYSRSAYL